jgi:hypothetical protein
VAGGRVVLGHALGGAAAPIGPDGRPTVFGAGPLEFRCVEPFRHWTATFRGPAIVTTAADQLATAVNRDETVDVSYRIDAFMAVPPWVYGQLLSDQHEVLETGPAGRFEGGGTTGGFRHEQLFRAEGTITIAGEATAFTGGGLRIHRVGNRQTAGFWGHAWQSALFPSGRAFGLSCLPPAPDGSATFNEAFLFDGERRVPARAVRAPFPTQGEPFGSDVSLVLESELGVTEITGETVFPTFLAPHQGPPACPPDEPPIWFEQSIARYRWDGEDAYGMVERS